MAFKVGAIVSKLTLDKSGWTKSLKSVEKDQKSMQGMSDKTAGKFKKMGAAMTIAGGAIIGALAGVTKAFVNTGDEIEKTSRRTGIGTEALSELKFAAELSGASMADLEKGVKRMSGTILDAKSGLETYARAFRQIGVSIDDLMKMNPEQQFITISEAIARIEDPTVRAALAQDMFGRAGTALLPMFDRGADGLKKMREEARTLGIVFSEDAARSAADLRDAQHSLGQSIKGVGLTIAKELAPYLTEIIKKMTATVVKVIDWLKANPKLTVTIVKITAGLGGLLTVLGPIVMLVPKLVVGAKMLAGGFTALLSPVGLLVGALAALAVGYMKVKKAKDELVKASKREAEVTDRVFAKLKKAADAAGITEREFVKLTNQYKLNAAAMMKAVREGKHGVEWQEKLKDVAKESAEEYKKQKEATDNLGTSMADLTGRFQGYLDELTKTKEETKTWVDYLKDIGVQTIQQKETRVKELTAYLGQLKKAYDEGKLTLEDYVNSTNTAKREIEELTTTITTTTIPAARDMSGVYAQAVGEMTTRTSDFTVDLKKETEEQRTIWSDLFTSIGNDLKSNLTEWLAGHQSFGDALSNIWDNLKTKFIGTLVEMGTSWATDFIGGMLSSAKEGFGTVADSVKNLGKGITDTIKGFSPGGLAQGVISGAVSGLVSGLVGGFPKHSQEHMRLIHENSSNILATLRTDFRDRQYNWFLDRYDRMLEALYGVIPRKFDCISKLLGAIKDNTAPIKNMISAAKGAVVNEPTLAALHGSPANPEIVTPVSGLIESLKGIGNRSATLSQSINVNIMVKDHLDPYSAQRIVREQIVPSMLKAIEVNSRNKTRMREILGVQI